MVPPPEPDSLGREETNVEKCPKRGGNSFSFGELEQFSPSRNPNEFTPGHTGLVPIWLDGGGVALSSPRRIQ